MAPSFRPSRSRPGREEEDFWEAKGDRKARKPLVEKKRRARINESLQELRLILADAEFQMKMENAEVLELTVKRVQGVLQSRSLESDKLHREASERFVAGYIQCMHEVHMFVSTCPGIDAAIAAELLNHLLESMPLNEGASFQALLGDVLGEAAAAGPGGSLWPGGDGLGSPAGPLSPLASPLSLSPSEDVCSDLEEASEVELSQAAQEGLDTAPCLPSGLASSAVSKCMWRPW
ncbi:transcription cofactor HES-6 [Monodelphis domestica]|uniref:Transcription cofactor HES-6 n=1 Tax=Monodelphis domestica TaxID=13616 RepID=F7D4T6_MONDO|nr:transcription cofactor HES-6 [Monodelphis domestica]